MENCSGGEGIIFDIQRYCVHDGPGIRTTVFFKGCSLRCFWCHNPESYKKTPELGFYPDKCIGCGKCLKACENGGHRIDAAGGRIIDRGACTACGRCARSCFAKAIMMIGRSYGVAEVMRQVLADAPFYKRSGGGLTCSGGEPLLQSGFLARLLAEARENGIHTAIDTAGNVAYGAFELAIPYADLVLYDLKCMDDARHREATGVSNALILDNFDRLASSGQTDIWVRIPVIPGVNDDMENMEETARFLSGRPAVKRVELLPYHSLGGGKYESFGLKFARMDLRPPTREAMTELSSAFRNLHVRVECR